MGSIREALMAGYVPKRMPTVHEMPSARMSDSAVTTGVQPYCVTCPQLLYHPLC